MNWFIKYYMLHAIWTRYLNIWPCVSLMLIRPFKLAELHTYHKTQKNHERKRQKAVGNTHEGLLRDVWAPLAQPMTPISLLNPAAVNWLSRCLSIIPFTYTYRIWCSTSEAWEPGHAQHKGTIVVTVWHGSGGSTSRPVSRRPDDRDARLF